MKKTNPSPSKFSQNAKTLALKYLLVGTFLGLGIGLVFNLEVFKSNLERGGNVNTKTSNPLNKLAVELKKLSDKTAELENSIKRNKSRTVQIFDGKIKPNGTGTLSESWKHFDALEIYSGLDGEGNPYWDNVKLLPLNSFKNRTGISNAFATVSVSANAYGAIKINFPTDTTFGQFAIGSSNANNGIYRIYGIKY
jgi:hypothetical protein